jgi:hypothetical protein
MALRAIGVLVENHRISCNADGTIIARESVRECKSENAFSLCFIRGVNSSGK